MKRLFLLPLLGGIFLASCHKSAPRAEMKTDVDTLSYEIGMANTQGIEALISGRWALILNMSTTLSAA